VSDPTTPTSRRPPRTRTGLLGAVQRLTAAQQRTAAASLVVLVSLGAPWYSTEVVFSGAAGQRPSVSRGTMTGIGAFSFVEAAVLLVAAAVLALVWARATERSFSLPISDGTVVTAAAGWLGVLIVYRLFDRPEGETSGQTVTLIGLSWGIFATLAAVGLLLATGLDQRRRDAERRFVGAGTAPPDAPVVDPADLVPVATAAPSPQPAPRDPAQPWWAGGGEHAAAQAPTERPVRPGPTAPQGDPGPTPPPGAQPHPSRSWSFDDPDAPEPAPPRSPPSQRRPTPPEDPTRPLGRGDAARQLRDAGVGTGAPAAGPSDGDPTRVAPPQDDRAGDPRVPPPHDRTDATRVVPPRQDLPDATPVVPTQDDRPGAAQAPEGGRRSRRLRRRDRD
jgi:hypothetical protein